MHLNIKFKSEWCYVCVYSYIWHLLFFFNLSESWASIMGMTIMQFGVFVLLFCVYICVLNLCLYLACWASIMRMAGGVWSPRKNFPFSHWLSSFGLACLRNCSSLFTFFFFALLFVFTFDWHMTVFDSFAERYQLTFVKTYICGGRGHCCPPIPN